MNASLPSALHGRPGSSRSMLHCGHSSQHFANLTLAEHPLLHLLASHELDCPKSLSWANCHDAEFVHSGSSQFSLSCRTQDLESLVTVAAGELPWPKWEDRSHHLSMFVEACLNPCTLDRSIFKMKLQCTRWNLFEKINPT